MTPTTTTAAETSDEPTEAGRDGGGEVAVSEAKLAKRAAEADARRLAEAARDHLTGHEGGISGTDLRNALRLYDAAHSGDEHAHEHAWETYRRQEVCTLTKCRDCGEVRWTPTPAPSKSGDPASRACYYSLEDADGNPSNCTRPNGHDGPHAIGFTDATAHSDPPARAARCEGCEAGWPILHGKTRTRHARPRENDGPLITECTATKRAESAAVEEERCLAGTLGHVTLTGSGECVICGHVSEPADEGQRQAREEPGIAYDTRGNPYRGYAVRAAYLAPPDAADALIEIFKDGEKVKDYKYPAYRIWNVSAHFKDMVDTWEQSPPCPVVGCVNPEPHTHPPHNSISTTGESNGNH